MASKISLIFEALGGDRVSQIFNEVARGAEEAGKKTDEAAKKTEGAGQSASGAAKHFDVLSQSVGKLSGLAGQAGVDLSAFQQAVGGAQEGLSLLGGGFSVGTAAAGAFAATVAGMTGALIATSQHLVSSYNDIKAFAAISGMAAGEADDLADAMQAVGIDSARMTQALFQLENSIDKGADGLRKLGISMDDIRTKSSGELFVMAIDRIQALGSQSEKTAALIEIFGARTGKAFAELVREGGDSIDQLIKKVEDLSPWTKEMETNARNLAMAQTFLGNAIGGLVDVIGNAFAPILTTAINAMTEWVVSIRKAIENSGMLGPTIDALVNIFKALWEAISPLTPILKEMGIAAVQVGLAMLAAFQGVMIPVVALTGAIGALWAAIQKAASGDFAGAFAALKTGMAETEKAVELQIQRFNEQVETNKKLEAAFTGVTASTKAAGEQAERSAPGFRTIGDEQKKAAQAAKTAAEAFAQAGQKLAAIAGAFETKDEQALARVANEFDAIARKVEALGPKFKDLAQQIRDMGAAAVELTKGLQAIKAFHDELKRLETVNTIFDNLQKSIDAIHMTEAQKELRGIAEQLEKIKGLGPESKKAILEDVEGLINMRDAAKEAVQQLKDAAKYMEDLTKATRPTTVELNELYEAELAAAQGLEEFRTKATIANSAMSASEKSAKQYADALGEIALKAEVLGPSFDAAGARISAMQARFADMAREAAATGRGVTDEMRAMGAAIEQELSAQRFDKAFQGMFTSVTDAFSGMAQGLIQGTLDIGDAFKNLGQSLIVSFVNVVIHEVFDPVLKAAGSFVAGLVRQIMGMSSGGFRGYGGGGGLSPIEYAAQGDFVSGGYPSITGGGGGFGGGGLGLFKSGFDIISGGASFAQSFPALNSAVVAFNAARQAGEGFFSSVGSGWQSFAANLSIGPMGTVLAGVGAALTAYQGIMALIQGRTGQGIGTLAGMGLGAAGGALAGTFLFPGIGTLAGGIIGAGLGGQIGGLIGGLFGMEDWEAIHKMRAVQRTRTSQALMGQIMDVSMDAADLTGLGEALKASAGGTGVRIGDVLLRMLTDYVGTEIGDLGKLEIPPEARGRLAEFLQRAGFEGADFAQGRVGSIQELVAAGGIKEWATVLEGLNAFILTMTTVERNVKSLTEAAADISGLSLEDAHEQAMRFFETLALADTLTEAGFEKAGQGIRDSLMTLAEGVEGGVDAIRKVAVEAFMEAPERLTLLLDMKPFQRAGETLQQTTERVGKAMIGLGVILDTIDVEIASLGDPLTAATEGFTKSMTAINTGLEEASEKFAEAAFRIDESSGLIGDPTEMMEQAKRAHDLIIERYKAIKALEEAINATVAGFYDSVGKIVQLAPIFQQVGINVGTAVEAMSLFVLQLPTVQSMMTGLAQSVNMFAQLAVTAGQTADPAMIKSAVQTWANLNDGFAAAAKKIMEIQDPNERMAKMADLMQTMASAAAAAAAGLQALVAYIDRMTASVVTAAEGLARHAPLLAQVGVDIGKAAGDMAKFSTSLSTWSSTQAAMTGAVSLGIGAFQAGQQINGQAFIDMFVSATQKALQITDPGQRTEALTSILDQIARVLEALPPEQRKAILDAFGPGIQFIGDQIIKSGEEAAKRAIEASEQLKAIIGPSGALNPQNFMAMMVSSINATLKTIMEGGYTLLTGFGTAMVDTARSIAAAITAAGTALSGALGDFTSANELLRAELQALDTAIGDAVRVAVEEGIKNVLGQHQLGTGPAGIPGRGATLAIVHGGEIIANPEESALIRAGHGIYGAEGYAPAMAAGTATSITAPITVHVNIGRATREDAAHIAAVIEQTVEHSIRRGRLRGAVQDAGKGLA